ncbi:MAG: hypothetical protein DMF26_16175 [Verrucomicrobia bacterium]|nr:MAG: hypothetical protein DMF26_16175 [Verrucomicrobiota bacterium]
MKTRDPLTKLTLLPAVLLTLRAAQVQGEILRPVSIGFPPVGISMDQTSFAHTYPHAIRTPEGQMLLGPLTLRVGGTTASNQAQSFQIVDALNHQDDFWSNMLVGDANHNGRQEIVVRSKPVNGGRPKFIFYEDDGTGHFDPVWSIDEPDGGLLAMGDIDGDGLTDLFIERALGICNHEFVRYEASSPSGFPDHIVWTGQKEGNVTDFNATIADVDGDGILELVTSDNNFTCLPTSLKVFESAPNDQMNLIFDYVGAGLPDLGNPVVADFDLDGRNEIVVAEGQGGNILVFEGVGNDSIVFSGMLSHSLVNAYQLALVDVQTPDGRPIVVLAGQAGNLDYRARSYEMLSDNVLTQTSETLVPNNCGASIPQIAAADLFGTRRQEIILDRLCDPVPIYTVGSGGALTLYESPSVVESLEVIGTRKTPVHSGAIALGTFPTSSNPKGKTPVLELQ